MIRFSLFSRSHELNRIWVSLLHSILRLGNIDTVTGLTEEQTSNGRCEHFLKHSCERISLNVRIQRGDGGVWTPLKNHKNIVCSSNTDPDPLKNCSLQASIQCWAVIGTPTKRNLMAFRWRADDGPFIAVFGYSIPLPTKKKVIKIGPSLKKLARSAHALQQT